MMPFPIFLKSFILFVFVILVLPAQPAYSSSAQSVPTAWDRIMEEESIKNIAYGYASLYKGEYSKAAVEFKSALQKNPNNVHARLGYGSALYWLGDIDKAYNEFEYALKLDSQNADAYQLRGIIKAGRGQYDDALDDFKKASRLNPGRGDIRMNMGSVYSVQGDLYYALANYRRAVMLDRHNPLFHLQLARAYMALGRENDAEKEYRQAIFIYPEYEDAIFELAMFLERSGRAKDAIGLYRRAIRLKPGDSVARFRLAALLYEAGRKTEIKKTVMPGFLIAPANEKGGVSVGLAYSSSGNNKNSSEKGNNSGKKGKSGSYPSIEELLSRVPDSHEIALKIEILETPKTELKKNDFSEKPSLGRKLASAMNRPKINYKKQEYFIKASGHKERAAKIAEIQSEVDKILKDLDSGNDVRMNINMDSAPGDSAGDVQRPNDDMQMPQKDMQNKNAQYIPRNVGNDMRLWVYGENWVEEAAELLDNLSQNTDMSPEFRLVRGLGYLLMGEISLAKDDFSGNGTAGSLGLSAAYTAEGNMEKAAAECEAVLSADPKNEIATQNLKWLRAKPDKKGK